MKILRELIATPIIFLGGIILAIGLEIGGIAYVQEIDKSLSRFIKRRIERAKGNSPKSEND